MKAIQGGIALVLCLGGMTLSACEGESPVVCTTIFAYGLSVQVQDSVTGQTLGSGVVITARDGAYQEDLQTVDGQHFFGAGERKGSYTIQVTKAGYALWERSGIVVTSDECHVHGVSLLAKLQPLP